MKKESRITVSLYLTEDLINITKNYCMFKKVKLSELIDQLILEHYQKNFEEMDKLNYSFEDLINEKIKNL